MVIESHCDGDDEDGETCQINNLSLGSDATINTEKVIDMDIVEEGDSMVAERWLSWCRSQTSIVICKEYDVPHGILPKGYNGVLVDVKVGGRKRVPDDKIYLAHAELRSRVARGNCVLELHKIERGKIVETKYIFLIFALKKFSGGLGDEDDSAHAQSQWVHYFTKSINVTKKVICTDKENGEAAHISCWRFLGQNYFCIGSKNVHMLIRNADDISRYADARFEFARRISRAFFRNYLENSEISEDKKESLIQFMQNNQLTLVAEMIQPEHQHVVNLSHLKHPELRFICWTKPEFSENTSIVDNFCSLPINKAIDKAREFGLQTIDYEVIEIIQDPTAEIELYIPKIRKQQEHEGKVLYFLDAEDRTIGLIKKKTVWYILLRALREKVASFESNSSKSLSDTLKSIRKRVLEIQKWLDLSDEYTEGWIEICTGFAKWLHSKKVVQIRSKFPVVFKDFLENHPEANQKYQYLLNQYEAKPSLS